MKQLIEDIAKALVDIPEEVSVQVVEGEQVTVLELKVAPSDLGKGDRQAGPHGPFHPHHSRSGRDEAEPPLHAGNSRVNQPEPAWVTIAVLGKTRGNRGEITAFPFSSKPERFQALKEVFLFGDGPRVSKWSPPGSTWIRWSSNSAASIPSPTPNCSPAPKCACPPSERVPLEAGRVLSVGPDRLRGGGRGQRRSALGSCHRLGGRRRSGLLVVDGGLLIPFARSICVEIDPAARRIAVELPEGLKDLNRT